MQDFYSKCPPTSRMPVNDLNDVMVTTKSVGLIQSKEHTKYNRTITVFPNILNFGKRVMISM